MVCDARARRSDPIDPARATVGSLGMAEISDLDQPQLCAAFLAMHHGAEPFVMANAWDGGSARLCEVMGFPALATTSSGSALRGGRLDYGIDLDTSLAIAAEMAAAVHIPVSVDFEDGFALDANQVAANFTMLASTGVAGGSIEDYTRDPVRPIYGIDEAVERVRAAVEAAHGGDARLVVAARTELLTGRGPARDKADLLAEVVDRLQRYQEAGADVLFAPGLRDPADIATVISEVDRPLSVMTMPGVPTVPEMAKLGVARVSLAGWLAYAALDAVRVAATEVLDEGTFEFMGSLTPIRRLVSESFTSPAG